MHFRELNYYYLAFPEKSPTSEIDFYFHVRSRLLLGYFQEAIEAMENPAFCGKEVFKFLTLQLKIFVHRDFQGLVHQLEILRFENFNLVLEAEKNFIMGYLLNQLDQNLKSLEFHFKAANLYEQANYPGQASVSLFNGAVACNHIGREKLYKKCLRYLDQLESNHPHWMVGFVKERLEVYLLIDRMEYESALSRIQLLKQICIQHHRNRDLESFLCLELYLKLKLKDIFKVEPIEFKDPGYQNVYTQLIKLSEKELLSETEINLFLKDLPKLSMESNFFIMLHDLLIEKAITSKNYQKSLEICRDLQEYTNFHQQLVTLVDFRFYEAECLIALGMMKEADTTLLTLQKDYLGTVSSTIEEKLKKLFRLTPNLSSCSNFIVNTIRVHLDLKTHLLEVDGTVTNLSSKPIIEKLLSVLFLEKKPLSLSELFVRVYDIEFNPILHSSRFNSLISRSKQLLGTIKGEGLIRRNNSLEIAYWILPRVIGVDSKKQDSVIEFIKSRKGPFRIREIRDQLSCSVRTIQMVLRHLSKNGILKSEGNNRGKVYELV